MGAEEEFEVEDDVFEDEDASVETEEDEHSRGETVSLSREQPSVLLKIEDGVASIPLMSPVSVLYSPKVKIPEAAVVIASLNRSPVDVTINPVISSNMSSSPEDPCLLLLKLLFIWEEKEAREGFSSSGRAGNPK